MRRCLREEEEVILRLAVFTARRLAKHGICRRRVSVCVSVTLRYCIKRLHVGSREQRRTIAP